LPFFRRCPRSPKPLALLRPPFLSVFFFNFPCGGLCPVLLLRSAVGLLSWRPPPFFVCDGVNTSFGPLFFYYAVFLAHQRDFLPPVHARGCFDRCARLRESALGLVPSPPSSVPCGPRIRCFQAPCVFRSLPGIFVVPPRTALLRPFSFCCNDHPSGAPFPCF